MELDDYEQEISRHRAYLIRLACRIAKCEAPAAEDIVQEALIKVDYTKIDLAKGDCRHYLTAQVRWVSIERSRRRPPMSTDLPEELPDAAETAVDALVRLEEEQAAEGERERQIVAINALPVRLRGIVYGRLEGLTFEQIAQQQGVSRQSVWQLYEKAVKILRRRV